MPNANILSFTSKGSIIFAGTLNNGIYISTTSGLTWTQSTTGAKINSLTANTNTVFAAISSKTPPNVSGSIKKSTNDGASWSTSNFSSLMVNSIAANGNTIFCGDIQPGCLYIN